MGGMVCFFPTMKRFLRGLAWLLGLFLLPPDDTLDRLAERLRATSPPVISKIAEFPASTSALLSRPLFDASGQAIPPTSPLHLQGLALNGARTAHTEAVKERIESVEQMKDVVPITQGLFELSKASDICYFLSYFS